MSTSLPGQAPPHAGLADDEIDLGALAGSLRAGWRTSVALAVAGGVVGLLLTFVVPARWTATLSFVPQGRSAARLPNALSGIAGQFGVNLGADKSESPRFYAELARSRSMLDSLLLQRYPQASGDSVRLLDRLDRGGRSPADSLERARRAFAARVSTRVDNQTDLVEVSIETPDPVLAAAVTNRVAHLLNVFNSHTRQSQARARRRFTEQRLEEATRELRATEGELQAFYQANRGWQQSPALQFAEARLRRKAELQQEIVRTLGRERETAAIEEVNDTPVLTVVDSAVVPQRRSFPRRSVFGVAGAVAGLLAGLGLALVRPAPGP